MTLHELDQLTSSCARHIYTKTPPDSVNASWIARLLYSTAIHESKLRYGRQRGFGWDDEGGAYSFWQLEESSVQDTVLRLAAPGRRELAVRCRDWLFEDFAKGLPHEHWFGAFPKKQLMRIIWMNPRMACMFARLHYLWIPEGVPQTQQGLSEYWLLHYNRGGKGTVEAFLESWDHQGYHCLEDGG